MYVIYQDIIFLQFWQFMSHSNYDNENRSCWDLTLIKRGSILHFTKAEQSIEVEFQINMNLWHLSLEGKSP